MEGPACQERYTPDMVGAVETSDSACIEDDCFAKSGIELSFLPVADETLLANHSLCLMLMNCQFSYTYFKIAKKVQNLRKITCIAYSIRCKKNE